VPSDGAGDAGDEGARAHALMPVPSATWCSRTLSALVEKVAVEMKQLVTLANFNLRPYGLSAEDAHYVGHLAGSAGARDNGAVLVVRGGQARCRRGGRLSRQTNKARGEAMNSVALIGGRLTATRS
jgi:hypothetical protein